MSHSQCIPTLHAVLTIDDGPVSSKVRRQAHIAINPRHRQENDDHAAGQRHIKSIPYHLFQRNALAGRHKCHDTDNIVSPGYFIGNQGKELQKSNETPFLPCIRCAKKLQGKKQKGNAEQHTFYGIYVIALINDNNQ